MPQKTKTRKVRGYILRFLRLFPEYRNMENYYRFQLEDFEHEVNSARAAIIHSTKLDMDNLLKKIESDTNLIESLNRYIAALETKAAYQADMLADLKRRLEEIIAKKNLTE